MALRLIGGSLVGAAAVSLGLTKAARAQTVDPCTAGCIAFFAGQVTTNLAEKCQQACETCGGNPAPVCRPNAEANTVKCCSAPCAAVCGDLG